jgi:hypothetical protein
MPWHRAAHPRTGQSNTAGPAMNSRGLGNLRTFACVKPFMGRVGRAIGRPVALPAPPGALLRAPLSLQDRSGRSL